MIIVLDIIFESWGVDPRAPFKSSTSKKVSFPSDLLIGIFIRGESFLVGESVEGSSFIIGSNNEDLQEVNTRNNYPNRRGKLSCFSKLYIESI